MGRLEELLGKKPIIGVIHLPPLPGYPSSPGIEAVVEKALGDLEAANAHALLAVADGAIVGTSLKKGPRVDRHRVLALVAAAHAARTGA